MCVWAPQNAESFVSLLQIGRFANPATFCVALTARCQSFVVHARSASPSVSLSCSRAAGNMKVPFAMLALCALLSALRPGAAYTDTTSEPPPGMGA